MRRLFLSECKKILKNKINLALILLILMFMGISTYNTYQKDLPYYEKSASVYKTFEGEDLSEWSDVIAYADHILSQYEGEANEALWNRYCDDYNTRYQEFTKDIDTAFMTSLYGKDYEALLETASTTGLSSEQIQTLNDSFSKHFPQEDQRPIGLPIDGPTQLPYFYEKQEELYTLELIYRNKEYNSSFINDRGTKQIQSEPFEYSETPLYFLTHKQENIKNIINPFGAISNDDPIYVKYVTETINTATPKFGSVLGVDYLTGAFSSFTFFSLLLISILLANSFAIEQRTKMNQIIVPSQTGAFKLCIAKLGAGLSIGCLTMLLQITVVLVIGCMLLPPSNWDFPIINQITQTHGINGSYLTYQDELFTRIQLLLLGAIAVSIFTMFLSCMTKNQFFTVIISILCILCPFVMINSIPLSISKLLPSSFLLSSDYLYTSMQSTSSGLVTSSPMIEVFSNVIWWKDLATILWIGLTILMIIIMLISEKRHRVVTH